MATYNSATSLLDNVMELQAQNLDALSKISESLSSAKESVVVNLGSNDYEIPSFGFMKSEFKRIDDTLKTIMGIDSGETAIRQADGSYKRLVISDVLKSPDKLTSLQVPSVFNQRSNWFFESFLNPLLFVTFDVTDKLGPEVQRVEVKRVIISDTTEAKKQWFDDNLRNKNDINHEVLFSLLQSKGIAWFIDQDFQDMPPSLLKASGTFDVIGITDDPIQIMKDGAPVEVKVRKYTLSKLTYTDNTDTVKDTQTLKIGDQLVSGKNTKYEITSIDSSKNQVVVKSLGGYEPIKIGSSTLRLYSEIHPKREIQINVGHEERQVIFFKPVDSRSNLSSEEWSQGVAFYSSSLLNQKGDMTLQDFYQSSVSDFGSFFLSIAKEKMIPSILGIVPNVPVIDPATIKVVKVNSHKLDTKDAQDLLSKASEKLSLQSALTQLDTSIAKKKEELGNTKFVDDTERNAVKNDIEKLVREKISKSSLYSSLTKELIAVGKNTSALEKGKFRARGFVPIPSPQYHVKTGNQNVIQMEIQYRYIRTDGNPNGAQQLDFQDPGGEKKRAFFSDWNSIKTDIRKKSYSITTGKYEWIDEDVANADVTNFNQIDIPITNGEKLEIRVRSISEAGWPINPLMSGWSETLTVDFPAEFQNDGEVSNSVQQALNEENRLSFQDDLNAKGLDLHLEDSFIKSDKYYPHSADNIASGFFTSEGNVINIFDKLKMMELELNQLKDLIANAKGSLSVFMLDTNGNKLPVSNNSTVEIFAGYYKDIVGAMATADQKGAIVTKIYYIGIQNAAASVLELISRYPGAFDESLPISASATDDYVKYAYDRAPLSLTSYNSTSQLLTDKLQPAPWQSSQLSSQFMYVRRRDIGLKNEIYLDAGPGQDPWMEPGTPAVDGSASNPFVWSGSGGNGVISEFCIHTDHPMTSSSFSSLQDPFTSGTALYPEFRHSIYFNLEDSDPNGKFQLAYVPTNPLSLRGKYPQKVGFKANDRYLIGKSTCGSYLFLSPSSYKDLLVDGIDFRAVKSIEFGDDKMVKIPVVFQFRMTDYFGDSSINEGKIGGWNSSGTYPQNISYTKKIGFDISTKNNTLFSFDIQISAKYKRDTVSQVGLTGINLVSVGNPDYQQLGQLPGLSAV